MIGEERMEGKIDQVDGLIYFRIPQEYLTSDNAIRRSDFGRVQSGKRAD